MMSAMFLGKLRPFLKSCNITLQGMNLRPSKRMHSFSTKPRVFYRDNIERDVKEEDKAQLLLTFVYAWITYFFINHYEDVIGHKPFPSLETFTDEELGVT
ncbi:hypothetical protein EWB00_009072 [Schistosoma japonicum]|uniref:SJCHGC05780 protein n=1 Tax=Schistosoma japonicum TaxID=6182 RepID=Q5DFH1_SCHJA|nr:SJCHGC05780 protein [Schistosoma japonicum]KAH8863626.1 hypothetical protein KSF78_0002756 [Schistosoma japonicum]KAH8863627.1 hypothetical protein KSF78_0002756 [Schistosoma japonicum]TNN19344.1 hypothetical protein EWB00_009072 [Schistosoma japonicum]TNN19345.1 hypothetical protein EWB00_009072 [Schistosoma japonicum]